MIVVEGLAKRFRRAKAPWWTRRAAPAADGADGGWVEAVRHVDFRAADGRITGLLGPNGAGKTTTLRIVAGLLPPDAGRAQVDGVDVAAAPRAAQARLGVLPDARGLYPRLTARENVRYHARLQGLDADEADARIDELGRWLAMTPLLDRRCAGFSQGERVKTALARALVHRPSHLILDEPTNGLDVVATRALREVLRRLRDEHGQCIVFSSHVMQEVERLCDHVAIVAGGRSVAAGTLDELRAAGGSSDFETAFVTLAYGAAGDGATPREGTP